EVFGVIEIQHGGAVDDAAADRGEVLADRNLRKHPDVLHPLHCHVESRERAGDRRSASSTVGLQHIAVEGDGPLADLAHVDGCAQRATDQTLDLVRPAAETALDGFASPAVVRGAREHRILGGDPTLSTAAAVRRHAVLHAGRDPHSGAPHPDQARTLRMYSHRELMMRSMPSTNSTTGSSKTSQKPMTMIRTKLTSSVMSGRYVTSAGASEPRILM